MLRIINNCPTLDENRIDLESRRQLNEHASLGVMRLTRAQSGQIERGLDAAVLFGARSQWGIVVLTSDDLDGSRRNLGTNEPRNSSRRGRGIGPENKSTRDRPVTEAYRGCQRGSPLVRPKIYVSSWSLVTTIEMGKCQRDSWSYENFSIRGKIASISLGIALTRRQFTTRLGKIRFFFWVPSGFVGIWCSNKSWTILLQYLSKIIIYMIWV